MLSSRLLLPRGTTLLSSRANFSLLSASRQSLQPSLSGSTRTGLTTGGSIISSSSLRGLQSRHAATSFGHIAPRPAEAHVGWKIAGIASCLGVTALCFLGNKTEYVDQQTAYADSVQQRVRSTYAYVATGLGITAGATIGLFRVGVAEKMMRGGWGMALGGAALTIGTMMGTMAVPQENVALKHAMMAAFNTSIALSLTPICFLGPNLVLKAAAGTAAVVGSFSLVAANSKSDRFLSWGGPLSLGLGVVFASSLGQIFFPGSSLLYNVSLYGGLGIFGGFVLYDTQKIQHKAAVMPHGQFDPINESIGLYMDTINIFIRLVQILAGGQRKK